MKITIVGCGNMGMIYARAFLKYNLVSRSGLLLAEKNASRQLELSQLQLGEVCLTEDERISASDVLIIAVKPQDFAGLAPGLREVMRKDIVVISIMAGMTISKITELLGHELVVRAMPNSPAQIGMGMTAYTAAAAVGISELRKAENILATTGRTVYLENESMLDAVTALSGSGPAYFFYLLSHMINAGKALGFDESTAAMLVKQTMLGSFHLLNTSESSLDELIKTVSSKGGTTEAALKVFEQEKVGENLQKGIEAACRRASELSVLKS